MIRMLLFVASWQRSEHLSVKKQKIKKKLYSSKWSLIIPSPDRSDLWSYHSQTEVTSDQTKVRSKHRVRSKCARNCLWSDLSRRKGPLIRAKSDHRPDDCAFKTTSDQTIVRSKVTPDQTIVRSKSPLIRLNCARNSLISEWFSLWTNFSVIYSFHKNWCLHY